MDSQVNVAGGAPVVKLTASAIEAVKRTLTSQNLAGHRLRIGLLPGGCAGFKYDLDVVREAQPGDLTFEQDGVGILVDAESVAYLTGTEIDYVDNGIQAGFDFKNPNARSSCGCGSSFQA